jgi:hypothetical protein
MSVFQNAVTLEIKDHIALLTLNQIGRAHV